MIWLRSGWYQTSVVVRAWFRNVGVAEQVISSSDKRNASRPAYLVHSCPKFMVFTMRTECLNFKTNIDVGYVSPARK